MYRLLGEVDDKMNQLLTRMANVEKQCSGPTVTKALELLPQPLRTKREVDELESKVANDLECRTAMVNIYLVCVDEWRGGVGRRENLNKL